MVEDPQVTTEEPIARGLVLVVGPDGVGKTTVLDALERQLGHPVARAHSRPGVIAGREGDGAPVTDPHAQAPRGPAGSLAKLAIVLLDTVVGTLARWRPLARRRLLVVERGWYDLAVDPHRYRLPRAFAPLVAALGVLVPKADVTVLLSGDAAAIHARKPEIGVAEVRRQLVAWERYARRAGARVVRIDTVGQAADRAAAQLLRELGTDVRWHRVPVAPPRLDLRATGPGPALALYRPHRRAARLGTELNGPLLRARLARPVEPPPIGDLDALVGSAAGAPRQLVAFRSSAPDRWILGVADDDRLHTVVKAGPEGDGLDREVEALRRLRSGDLITLPTLLTEQRSGGWHAVAMRALPGSRQPTLAQVASVTTALVRGDLGVPVVHGDLAPWNLAVEDGRVLVWDWEESELDVARPLHDLTHYVIRAGTLLGRFDATTAARLLTAPSGIGARHLTELGLSVEHAADLVGRYLERTSPSTSRERVFRAALADALRSA
jgi:DNA polymerase III delta prime subunit